MQLKFKMEMLLSETRAFPGELKGQPPVPRETHICSIIRLLVFNYYLLASSVCATADCIHLVQRRSITHFLITTVCLSGNIRQKEDFTDCWYSNILACLLYVTYVRLGACAYWE